MILFKRNFEILCVGWVKFFVLFNKYDQLIIFFFPLKILIQSYFFSSISLTTYKALFVSGGGGGLTLPGI